MKKIGALILVAVMLLAAFPVSVFAVDPVIAIDNAAEFAAMDPEKSYKLTTNISVGSEWITIPEFSGTLDGNGYTITLPTNAPLFDKLTGTVKNVVFNGTVALDTSDVSLTTIDGDSHKYVVGAVASHVTGATVENVKFSASITFSQTNAEITPVAVGGMFGAAFTGTKVNDLTFDGSVTVNFTSLHARSSVGGVIAYMNYDVDISNCLFTGSVTADKISAYAGGIVGFSYNKGITDGDVSTIKNSFFNGTVSRTNASGERAGGIVGYSNGITIENCAANAQNITINGSKNSSCCGLLAYGAGSLNNPVLVKDCVDVNSSSRPMCLNSAYSTSENVIRTASGNGIAGSSKIVGGQQIANANEALAEFAKNNDTFTFAESTLTLTTVSAPVNSHVCSFVTINDSNNASNVSTGKCSCGTVTDDPYAGFIQYTQDGMKLRVVMVIAESELEAAGNKTFKMKVTINNQTALISDNQLTAYTSVDADGKEYVAEEGYYIFGVILTFEEDMSASAASVTITYDGEASPVYSGSSN